MISHRRKTVLIACLLVASLLSCAPGTKEGRVVTVMGPISPEEMGQTLVHEHVLVDFIGARETGYHRWDLSLIHI